MTLRGPSFGIQGPLLRVVRVIGVYWVCDGQGFCDLRRISALLTRHKISAHDLANLINWC